MFVINTPADVPKCALVRTPGQSMGDVQSGVTSLAQSLGTNATTLLLVGGGALLAGWALNSLVTGGSRSIRRKQVTLRRRGRRVKRFVGDLSNKAIAHQTPTWQALLLLGVSGAAVYFIVTRVLKGGQQA